MAFLFNFIWIRPEKLRKGAELYNKALTESQEQPLTTIFNVKSEVVQNAINLGHQLIRDLANKAIVPDPVGSPIDPIKDICFPD